MATVSHHYISQNKYSQAMLRKFHIFQPVSNCYHIRPLLSFLWLSWFCGNTVTFGSLLTQPMKSLVSQWHWWELFTQLKRCLYFSLNLVYLWLLPFNVRIRCISVIKMEMCLQTPRRTPEFTPLAVLTSSHFFLELEPGWCRQEPTSSCIKKQKLIFCNHGKRPNVRGNRKKKSRIWIVSFFSVSKAEASVMRQYHKWGH